MDKIRVTLSLAQTKVRELKARAASKGKSLSEYLADCSDSQNKGSSDKTK